MLLQEIGNASQDRGNVWPSECGDVKARLVITAVVVEGRSQAEVARASAVSKGWVSGLVARYEADGEAALEPGWRRPKTSPTAIGQSTVDLILELRRQLSDAGLD